LNNENQALAALSEYVEDPSNPDADEEVQSTVMVIMLKRDPQHLAVITKHPDLRAFSKEFLISPDADILKLKSVGHSDTGIDYYLQGNSAASRKQVAPTCQKMLTAFRHHRRTPV